MSATTAKSNSRLKLMAKQRDNQRGPRPVTAKSQAQSHASRDFVPHPARRRHDPLLDLSCRGTYSVPPQVERPSSATMAPIANLLQREGLPVPSPASGFAGYVVANPVTPTPLLLLHDDDGGDEPRHGESRAGFGGGGERGPSLGRESSPGGSPKDGAQGLVELVRVAPARPHPAGMVSSIDLAEPYPYSIRHDDYHQPPALGVSSAKSLSPGDSPGRWAAH